MTNFVLANMFIPYFIGQTKAGLLLLIPVIIIETLLLIPLLRLKWLEVFKLCIYANIISTLIGALFILIDLAIPLIQLFSIAIMIPVALVISIWVEYRIYKNKWKQIAKQKLLRSVIIVNVITYIPLTILTFEINSQNYRKRMAKVNRIACYSNIKQLGLALQEYASDFNGWLPDKSGVTGLELLRSNGYLDDYAIFVCPAKFARKPQGNIKLTEDIVSFIYKAGYNLNTFQASTIPIAWDKPDNHKNYGNVLYLDGHVKGFHGVDWMEKPE